MAEVDTTLHSAVNELKRLGSKCGHGISVAAGCDIFVKFVTRKNLDWNIDDQYFAVADTAFIMGFGTFAFFPLLAVAIRMCPVNCEATVYATVMAAGNLGTFIAAQLGALITYFLDIDEHHFDNLWILVIICSVSKLLPLLTLYYLTPGSDADTSQGATTKVTRGKKN